ncbi:MAG: DUF2520 domain-containing protein [Acidobacteria bacterium]|nr:DUF2520 domain-containing protein [Acidobacteriota bacterium]
MTPRGPRYAIAGAGRAGGALAAALAAAGVGVTVWDRDPRRARRLARAAGARAAPSLAAALAGADVLVIAASDAAVRGVAAAAARRWPEPGPRAALHIAGAYGTELLDPLARRGAAAGVCHPLVPLNGPGSADALAGCSAAVSGDGAAGLRAARALARLVGARPVAVRDASRPLVHLAAVLAAGDLHALLTLSEELLVLAGVGRARARRIAADLASRALANFAGPGGTARLTGPAARGDDATLRRHFAALAARKLSASPVAAAHRALALAAAETACAAGALPPAALRRVRRALSSLPRPATVRTLAP